MNCTSSRWVSEATAHNMDMDLSETLEPNLAADTRQRLETAWLEENIANVAAYNEHIASNGVFSDGLRSF